MTPQERAMQELNRAAFDSFDSFDDDDDSYDPEMNDYDPDNAVGPIRQMRNKQAGSTIKKSPRRTITGKAAPQAQFDITITNTLAADVPIQLFNAQNTVVELLDPTTGYKPSLSASVVVYSADATTVVEGLFYGISRLSINPKVVYWDQEGSLVYLDETSGGTCVISCKQIPYRSLMKYSERGSFRIDRMRMKFKTSDQINQDFTVTQRTFLGLRKSNSISPSSYFSPQQYQSLILDIPVPVDIDAERGINYTMRPTETLLINMFISNYSKSAL